ncbi:MAG: hypothetical protein ACREEQ_08395, partial [Caulobacteraceae bacterium]
MSETGLAAAVVMVRSLGSWRVKDFDPGGGEAARAFDDAAQGADWIDAPAPGDIYLALHAAGR